MSVAAGCNAIAVVVILSVGLGKKSLVPEAGHRISQTVLYGRK